MNVSQNDTNTSPKDATLAEANNVKFPDQVKLIKNMRIEFEKRAVKISHIPPSMGLKVLR